MLVSEPPQELASLDEPAKRTCREVQNNDKSIRLILLNSVYMLAPLACSDALDDTPKVVDDTTETNDVADPSDADATDPTDASDPSESDDETDATETTEPSDETDATDASRGD